MAEGIGQQMETWASQERREMLQRRELLRPEKAIPILYSSHDGTGVPMTQEELMGRKGKQADGSVKTREAKLGCVLTRTTRDVGGFQVRDSIRPALSERLSLRRTLAGGFMEKRGVGVYPKPNAWSFWRIVRCESRIWCRCTSQRQCSSSIFRARFQDVHDRPPRFWILNNQESKDLQQVKTWAG